MLNAEHFAATNRANFEALLGITAKVVEGVEQLTELNLQVIKTSLGDAAKVSLAALSLKDPHSLLAWQATALQPAAKRAAAYGRQVFGIVASTKAEIEKVATEQAAALQHSFLAAVDAASKKAPEGPGSRGIALFQSAVTAANNMFDSMQRTTRQAADAAAANYTTVTD